MTPKRWVNIGFGFVALITVLVLRQLIDIVWDFFRLPIYENGVVSAPEILAVLGGLAVFFGLRANQKVNTFSTEVIIELSKVTWPVKKETLVSTIVVIVMAGIASILVFGFDFIWGTLTQKFLTF